MYLGNAWIGALCSKATLLSVFVDLYSTRSSSPECPAIKQIGVLTGGGDAPGLNAVIRAVVKTAANAGIEVIGLEDSFDGLIYPERSRVLTPQDVTGILRLGGTILGTINRGNPFAYPIVTPGRHVRLLATACIEMFHEMGLDALVVHRRRRHAGDRARVLQEGHPARRRAEDDRQRHRRHDELFRLRHRGQLRHRRDRSPAHDRRSAPPRSWSSR